MLADMLLLKSCIGVVGKETASLRFPKTAIQKIFQIFYTKFCAGVRAWACGVQLYKKGKIFGTNKKAENAFYPKRFSCTFINL